MLTIRDLLRRIVSAPNFPFCEARSCHLLPSPAGKPIGCPVWDRPTRIALPVLAPRLCHRCWLRRVCKDMSCWSAGIFRGSAGISIRSARRSAWRLRYPQVYGRPCRPSSVLNSRSTLEIRRLRTFERISNGSEFRSPSQPPISRTLVGSLTSGNSTTGAMRSLIRELCLRQPEYRRS